MSFVDWVAAVVFVACAAIAATALVYERDRRRSYAAFDAEVADLRKQVLAEIETREAWKDRAEKEAQLLLALGTENCDLMRKLAPFRRKRGAGGRFAKR